MAGAKGQRLLVYIARKTRPQRSVALKHRIFSYPGTFSDQAGKPPDKRGFSPPALVNTSKAEGQPRWGWECAYSVAVLVIVFLTAVSAATNCEVELSDEAKPGGEATSGSPPNSPKAPLKTHS